jgi:3-hydroxyacyl-[acyl-carrier-protein] dehydratase
MPGVLQVEALAQAMAVYVARTEGFGNRLGVFAKIEECRFTRMVTPGETLQLEIVMQKLGSRMGSAVGTASVNGEKACSATITFVIPPESALPNPSGSTAS